MSRRFVDDANVDLRVQLGALDLPNPIVAASGTFGKGGEFARVCPPERLGAVTVKSLAAFEWAGNDPLRVAPLAGAGMINSVGLAGPGVAAWIADDLPELCARGARVIVSLWGRSVEEYRDAATQLGPALGAVQAVEINLSCPNLGGHGMFAQDPELTREAVAAVRERVGLLPVLAKLTAQVNDVVEVAAAAVDAGATGLTLINTLSGFAVDLDARRARLGAGNGGVSGPPLKAVALRVVRDVVRAIPSVPVVGTGGVRCGRDAAEMIAVGATAVGVGTATFAEPAAPLRILDELARWCDDAGVATLDALRGTV